MQVTGQWHPCLQVLHMLAYLQEHSPHRSSPTVTSASSLNITFSRRPSPWSLPWIAFHFVPTAPQVHKWLLMRGISCCFVKILRRGNVSDSLQTVLSRHKEISLAYNHFYSSANFAFCILYIKKQTQKQNNNKSLFSWYLCSLLHRAFPESW